MEIVELKKGQMKTLPNGLNSRVGMTDGVRQLDDIKQYLQNLMSRPLKKIMNTASVICRMIFLKDQYTCY